MSSVRVRRRSKSFVLDIGPGGRSTLKAVARWLFFVAGTALLGFLANIQIHNGIGSYGAFQFDAATNREEVAKTIFISAYNKGGGNVLGEILGSRQETFYVYEPLVTIADGLYFKNYSAMCKTSQNKCFNSTLSSTAVLRLRSLASCFSVGTMGNEYHRRWDIGGEVWLRFHECLQDRALSEEFCTKYLAYQCKRAGMRVAKIERISVELLGTLLHEYQNLSIVHMFRDPRGIIHAQSKSTAQANLKYPTGIRKYAHSLCSRMADDIEAGTKLTAMYPKRFKMMLFEDFRLDMTGVIRPLFRFFGIMLYTTDKKIVESVALKKMLARYNQDFGENAALADIAAARADDTDLELGQDILHPFNWRTEINMDTLVTIDKMCGDVYAKLGYNVYENETRLRDMKGWPSYGAGGIYPL